MLTEEFENIVDSIALINEEEDIPVKPAEEAEKEVLEEPKEEAHEEASPREAVRTAIEPQVEIASSLITSIAEAFDDKCSQTKKMFNMEDQIKNWEKTIRGACQQIVNVVENKKLTIDKSKCSPRAYKKISHSDSRDLSTLDLCAAVIVFHNSLKG